MTANRRPLLRWPFLLLAVLAVAIVVFAAIFTRNMPDSAPAPAAAAHMGPVEAWIITAALVLVALAIPAKVYRWAILGGAALLILALFLI